LHGEGDDAGRRPAGSIGRAPRDSDYILGPDRFELKLVEYGSHACPYCRALSGQSTKLR
jgi:hypothetical protein